jgi:predicted oxidoreductase (fatty acid repression mutant protein)
MSNLSDLIPAGGGQNNTDFVADGTIVSGKPVILTAAGKVAPIAMASSTAGTPVVYETAAADHTTAVFDSDSNKVVIAYRDEGNSDHGTAVVGTVSGTTISYGTPVVFEAAASSWTVAVFDSNSNKVVIAYRDEGNSNYGTAIVGTVSGTSISFGTPVVFSSANSYYMGGTFDSSNNKVVIAYSDGTMKAIVATVSGTSVSFGTAVQFDAASTTKRPSAAFDSNAGKVVIAWGDNVSAAGTAIVGTVSGTAISFGTEVGFEAGGTYFTATIFDPNAGKVVIAYSDGGNSYYATAIVGTVSGTTISFGTAVVFDESWDEWFSAAFDSNANQTIISYKDGGNSNYGTAINGTVSGTAISFGTAVVFETSSIKETATVFDSNSNKVVIAYEDVGNSSYGTGVVYSTGSSNLTATNLLGVASAAIADTETGTINTWGSRNEVQTGLTIASDYYVQNDGTITTSSSGQLIGKAISATQINIKDYTG